MTDDTKFTKSAPSQAARFAKDEDGAITVDWIVLTAAVVGLAAVGGGSINDAVTALGSDISDETSGQSVNNGD
ncbi:MAG: hypothetical protein AAF231_02600 [Pseudomonadota bacterium]